MEKKDKLLKQKKIKIEIQLDDHFSYYVDVNGLLNGQWGGYEELDETGPTGEAMFKIYYDRFSQYTVINEFGFFTTSFHAKNMMVF